MKVDGHSIEQYCLPLCVAANSHGIVWPLYPYIMADVTDKGLPNGSGKINAIAWHNEWSSMVASNVPPLGTIAATNSITPLNFFKLESALPYQR